MSVDYADLIGIPYATVDCGELVAAALRRCGRQSPVPEDVLEAASRAADAGKSQDEILAFIDEHLEVVGVDDAQPGDIVFICHAGGGEVDHVGIVVEPGLMLHTVRGRRSRTDLLRKWYGRIHAIGRTKPC